ncbi:alpha/beta fold hydrolase [Metabacillus rhizolycopersici]|uniref:Alpha/beta hydrolase n=1 Tax=Metabacillus rhizolycopersici TaxID=2875709 RepID=A0ABS7URA9_9BACI|nr:alpha/beta fold hydrolase [Metabacillus rhizolycopersici]MBZ5750612.1 alpha/beta hydrolase [Metabacillus rhizolycopersici]
MDKNYLHELKNFVELHIKSQYLKHVEPLNVLDRIFSYDNETEGSWEYEWLREGNRVLEKSPSEAIQCYNFARFPYANNEMQKEVYNKLVESFTSSLVNTGIKKEYHCFQDNVFTVYTSNLSPEKPLLLVMGGIVSIKEQWYKFLEVGPLLGFSVIVAEFPNVGENSLTFKANSYEMIQEILNHYEGEVDVENSYYVGMSFGGQLGIQCALKDSRIKGIVTVGAPLYEFYNLANNDWDNIPVITKKTLSHVCALTELELKENLSNLSIDVKALSKLKIPITYVFSLKDEIIPITELEFIQRNINNLDLITFDDVHGSPNHMDQIQKLIPEKILNQYKDNQSKVITDLNI